MWRQSRFWVITLIFLGLNLAIVWLIYPPLLARFRSVKQQSSEIRSKLVDDRQFVANLDALKLKSVDIERYFQAAKSALPPSVASDILILQLDGLLQAANLSQLTVTVPFSQGVSTTVAPTIVTPDSEVKAGSVGNNRPAQPTTGANPAFTISGEFGFSQMKTLLSHLATLVRWHRLTSLELTASAAKTTGSLTASIFTLADSPTTLDDLETGFLETAKKVFDPLRTYATTPNSKSEGNFGRSDPLAPL